MLRRYLPFFVVASLAVPGGTAWAYSAFVDLSATDGYTQANPTGVGDGGVTVLQGPLSTTSPTLFYHTFLYPGASNGTMTDITSQFTGAVRIGSTNMNGNGQFVACQTSPASGTNATGGWFYSGGTATPLPTAPGANATYAVGINNNGDVAGYWISSTGTNCPYIRTGGTDYELNTNGAGITALNTNGQAVGYLLEQSSGSPPDALAWTYTISGGSVASQTLVNLQEGLTDTWRNVFASAAVAINSAGQVVIAADTDGVNNPTEDTGGALAFLYNMMTQAYTELSGLQIYDGQLPTGTGTQFGGHAEAINDSGQVVGRMLTSSSTYDAAIWQNGTLTDLNTMYGPSGLNILPSGFTLTNATAIDDKGDIAGYGTDALGNTNQAFVIYAPTLGDANLDGRVDINDLTIVLSHFGQTGMTWTQGEFTGNGKVDINDLTDVLSHFGQTVGASAGSPAAVPEPSALLLLAAGLAALSACARLSSKCA